MRTDKEIIDRIAEVESEDWLGTQRNELVCRLPFDKAKQWLRSAVTETEWRPLVKARDRETILSEMLNYMPFAWEKANNCRGISASRSMEHYSAWIWLLGDDLGDLSDYQYYGKDNLVAICNKYGWNSSQWDDGVRVNSEAEL